MAKSTLSVKNLHMNVRVWKYYDPDVEAANEARRKQCHTEFMLKVQEILSCPSLQERRRILQEYESENGKFAAGTLSAYVRSKWLGTRSLRR